MYIFALNGYIIRDQKPTKQNKYATQQPSSPWSHLGLVREPLELYYKGRHSYQHDLEVYLRRCYCGCITSVSVFIPTGSIYFPFKDSGSKHHARYSLWNQSPEMGSMWNFWDSGPNSSDPLSETDV